MYNILLNLYILVTFFIICIGGEKKKMFEKMKEIVALAKRDAEKFMGDRLAQAGTANITGIAMAIFVLVVIGYVSIYVVNEIHGIAAITSGSVFYTASNKVITLKHCSIHQW